VADRALHARRGLDQLVEFSGSETLDAFCVSGGPYRLPGDYVYSNQRLPYSSRPVGYVRCCVRRYSLLPSLVRVQE